MQLVRLFTFITYSHIHQVWAGAGRVSVLVLGEGGWKLAGGAAGRGARGVWRREVLAAGYSLFTRPPG